MEKTKSISECMHDIFSEIIKKGDIIEKLNVEEYEKTLCDYIEKLIHETEEKERVKCFGGNCVISFVSDSVLEKKIFKISNENEATSKEYANSEVTLYFKDINDKWLNQKALGRLEIEKFDLTDEETKEFICKIKAGEKIEHKID